MKMEGSNAEYYTGDEALQKKAQWDKEKTDREQAESEQRDQELKEKFDAIEIGDTVGYKTTPETPVEFYDVSEKDSATKTLKIRKKLEIGNGEYGIDAVTMEKIIDVQKNRM
jgi:hypothetical protein